MMKHIGIFLVILSSITACNASGTKDGEPNETGTAVNDLVAETLKNMVFVKGGSFMMGDYVHIPISEGRYPAYWSHGMDSKPAHKVTLDSFHIGKYEVTFREYDVYAKANNLPLPAGKYIGRKSITGITRFRKPDKPATKVSWQEARDYCHWLGRLTGLPFDLPTEAQWEYAARSRGRYVGFATDTGLADIGRNFPPFEEYGHPVGKFPPNPLGIYDMSANVDEWVLDWYDEDYYQHSPEINPTGPKTGTKKVVRGGSYLESPGGSTVYGRKALEPDSRIYNQGFRCAINQPTPIPQAHIPDDAEVEKALAPYLKPPAKQ